MPLPPRIRSSLALALASAAVALVLAPAVGQQVRGRQDEVQVDRLAPVEVLMRNFEPMALGDAAERNKWTAAQRWREPVRAILIGESADQFRDDVRALLATFEVLTGIPFSLADGDGAANLRIYFSERDWYRTQVARSFPRPDTVVCFTNTSIDANGAIGRANTIIPEDLSARAVRTCLAHELLHAISFQGHPVRTFESALRNGIGVERLTINDQLIIRTLYDERLRFNMTPDEALAVATAILTALHEQLQKAKDPLDVLSQGGRAPRAPPPWTGGPV